MTLHAEITRQAVDFERLEFFTSSVGPINFLRNV